MHFFLSLCYFKNVEVTTGLGRLKKRVRVVVGEKKVGALLDERFGEEEERGEKSPRGWQKKRARAGEKRPLKNPLKVSIDSATILLCHFRYF